MVLPSCGLRLTDKFAWDLANPDNDPRVFASLMLKEMSLDSPENSLALEMQIRQQIDAYCARSCLNLKQNIDAIIHEDKDEDVSDTDGGCPLADFDPIVAPKKKRDWKALSKTLQTQIDRSDIVDPYDAMALCGVLLRSEHLKPSRARAFDNSSTPLKHSLDDECGGALQNNGGGGSSFTSQQQISVEAQSSTRS